MGFNGNKKRRGLGYCLTTPGGLLAKAGYAPGDVREYLADLEVLAERLDLVAVGIHKSTAAMFTLDTMRAALLGPAGAGRMLTSASRSSLRPCQLRCSMVELYSMVRTGQLLRSMTIFRRPSPWLAKWRARR